MSDNLNARMEAVIRRIAEWGKGSAPNCPLHVTARDFDEARAIVSELPLPKPVDPDLLEARRICQAEESHVPGWYDEAGPSFNDKMRIALAAIKRGRTIAAEKRV